MRGTQMTEQEAKTKWCPHMPYCVNPHQVAVVSAAEYKQTRCCASGCMMWRWAESVQEYGLIDTASKFYTTETERPAHIPKTWNFRPSDEGPSCWAEPEEETLARRKGYCGLAGKP